ncbi:MAG: hypothetical protein K2I93_04450, partial [Oscillospiraceae bacterium]|nr:hypothetical protein [Oscillospiraceae bacterium]
MLFNARMFYSFREDTKRFQKTFSETGKNSVFYRKTSDFWSVQATENMIEYNHGKGREQKQEIKKKHCSLN